MVQIDPNQHIDSLTYKPTVASLRIIDPSRDWTRDEEEPSDDYNVTQLVIADNNKKKKKVYIDETANQFQSPNDQLSINEVPPDRFL
jgi:hypothetical protein